MIRNQDFLVKTENLRKFLVRVDIYVMCVHNSPTSLYRRGEVSSPSGLGNPTPTEIDSILARFSNVNRT